MCRTGARIDGVGGGFAGGDIIAKQRDGNRANIWACTTIPSVRELLVVHSTRIEAELLRRRPDSTWPEQPDILGADAILTLQSIEFSAPLTALYRTSALAVG